MTSSPLPPRSWLSRLFLTPGEPRLRAGWRILGHFMLMIVFFTIGSFALAPLYLLAPQYLLLGSQVVSFFVITLSIPIARRWLDRRSFTSLGLHWDRQAARDLVVGLCLPVLMIGGIFLMELAFGWLEVDGFAWQKFSPIVILRETALIGLIFILVGWQEELLTRGYWLVNLSEGVGMPLAVILTSVVFAVGHAVNPNSSWVSTLGLVLAGLFFAYAFLATRQLWLPIGLHIAWNFMEGPIFGFPVSGITDFLPLIQHTDRGPALITGGAFGPEAGLIQIPALLLGVLIIHFYTRGRLSVPGAHPAPVEPAS